ncbi:MAG TPA: hypothetical protein PLX33_01140 [Alphaproteobacteria bacterium]|nr:hypothetical protein [Alphaproteobacteria bacterium]
MFEEQGNEGHENIIKAQDLFRRLMECEPGGEFKKIFADAIQQHTLDEFYPVVVRAELSAALMLCHIAAAQVPGFLFRDYLQECCGLRPAQLVNLPLRDVADISEMKIEDIEGIARAFGYQIKDGILSDHPDAQRKGGKDKAIVSLDSKRSARHTG